MNWIDEIYRMWVVTLWEKVFIKNQREDLSELRKICNAVWERDMGSWRLTENQMAILRRTEKAMCGVKMIKKMSQKLGLGIDCRRALALELSSNQPLHSAPASESELSRIYPLAPALAPHPKSLECLNYYLHELLMAPFRSFLLAK